MEELSEPFYEGGGADGFKENKGRQHHTLQWLRCFFCVLSVGRNLYSVLGGVTVCYSAQLMMGNPGYIFF